MVAEKCVRDVDDVISTSFELPAADLQEFKKYTFEAKMKLTGDAGSNDEYFVKWEITYDGGAFGDVSVSNFVSK